MEKEKRSIIEERRKNWMRDRHTSLIRDEVSTETNRVISNDDEYSSLSSSKKHQFETEYFLDKLTNKLALSIREEVLKEMKSSEFSTAEIADKMDSYLQDELMTVTLLQF